MSNHGLVTSFKYFTEYNEDEFLIEFHEIQSNVDKWIMFQFSNSCSTLEIKRIDYRSNLFRCSLFNGCSFNTTNFQRVQDCAIELPKNDFHSGGSFILAIEIIPADYDTDKYLSRFYLPAYGQNSVVDEEEFHDFVIRTNGGEILVKKVMLANSSYVFHRMILDMIESKTNELEIVDFDHEIVSLAIKFIYSMDFLENLNDGSESDYDFSTELNLLLFADKYDIKSLHFYMQFYLMRNINEKLARNFCQMPEKAKKKAVYLRTVAREFLISKGLPIEISFKYFTEYIEDKEFEMEFLSDSYNYSVTCKIENPSTLKIWGINYVSNLFRCSLFNECSFNTTNFQRVRDCEVELPKNDFHSGGSFILAIEIIPERGFSNNDVQHPGKYLSPFYLPACGRNSVANDEEFHDFVIRTNGGQISVNKAMLANCSDVFKRMILDMKESKTNELKIVDFDHEIVSLAIKFIYSADFFEIFNNRLKLDYDFSNALNLLLFAKEFDIKSLHFYLQFYLMRNINGRVARNFFEKAQQANAPYLRTVAGEFFQANGMDCSGN